MTLLHRYLIRDFLTTFLVTLAVLTFVMCLGALLKAVDVLAAGGSLKVIALLFLYNLPYVMTFSIPLSALMSALLMFGRLSMDGEITALRSSGVSMWQIAAPVLLMGMILSFICLFINYQLSPDSYHNRRNLLAEQNPTELLQAGDFNSVGPYQIRFQRKEGDRVFGVTMNEIIDKVLTKSIMATDGVIILDQTNQTLFIELYDCLVDERGADNPDVTQRLQFPISLEEMFRTNRKKMKGRSFGELRECIIRTEQVFPDLDKRNPDQKATLTRYRLQAMVEMNKRIALSFSCFCFVLLAIPLGMRSKRKDSPMGFFMALVVAIAFFAFVLLAEALQKDPTWYPDTLMWIPLIFGQIGGFLLLRRIQ